MNRLRAILSGSFAAALLLLALPLAGRTAGTPFPDQTEPPGLSSGPLAPRQFVVHSPQGTGRARYYGTGSLEGNATATRALIIVHGVLRDAGNYFATGKLVLAAAHARNTLLIAPQFVEQSDLAGRNVPADTLYWSGKWPGGSPAIAPAPVSSYAVFDAMIARLTDRARFPKMREIVIAGHSAGGQIVQRYAVVGHAPDAVVRNGVRVHLIVANPSSYFYFGDYRPYPHANCPDFNHWRYGLIGAPPYVRGSAAQLEAQYAARDVTYLLGTADTNAREWDLDKSCGGEAQGPYRFARGKLYIAYMQRRHPRGTEQDYAFVPGVPHDNRRMFTSACGIAVIFGRARNGCGAHGRV